MYLCEFPQGSPVSSQKHTYGWIGNSNLPLMFFASYLVFLRLWMPHGPDQNKVCIEQECMNVGSVLEILYIIQGFCSVSLINSELRHFTEHDIFLYCRTPVQIVYENINKLSESKHDRSQFKVIVLLCLHKSYNIPLHVTVTAQQYCHLKSTWLLRKAKYQIHQQLILRCCINHHSVNRLYILMDSE